MAATPTCSSMMTSCAAALIRRSAAIGFALLFVPLRRSTQISPEFILCSAADIGRPCVRGWTRKWELETMVTSSGRTAPRHSMPQRSDHPGLKWRRTAKGRQPYWVARQVVRDTKGFPDRTIRLPRDVDQDALAELCRDHTARLMEFLAEPEPSGLHTRYDGSIRSLSRLFQEHPDSTFNQVKRNTRDSYTDSLKVIEGTIGNRAIRKVTVLDVQRYYRLWRAPRKERGLSRTKRAHDAVATLRMILRFGFAIGIDECGALVERLKMVRFEKSPAREQEMTYAHATAFVRKALELGESGTIP